MQSKIERVCGELFKAGENIEGTGRQSFTELDINGTSRDNYPVGMATCNMGVCWLKRLTVVLAHS